MSQNNLETKSKANQLSEEDQELNLEELDLLAGGGPGQSESESDDDDDDD